MNADNLSADALLAELDLLAAAPRWWVALSGGLDSTVLLHLLARARTSRPNFPPLTALYVNHGLHPDSARWAQHCQCLCRELGVPLESETVSVTPGGRGLESAAREARHAVFEARVGEGEMLFTAHHQDDQVETFFLRLLRGAGVDGLGAMAPSRPLGAGTLRRPLLAWPRAALEDYARKQGLSYVDDPSNSDTGLDRNFLRHQVLPLVAGRWPGYRDTVSRAAAHLREASGRLRELTPDVPRCDSVMGDEGLELAPLLSLPDSLAGQVLRDWLGDFGLEQAPDQSSLREFLRQLRQAGADSSPRLDCGELSLQRFREGVYARWLTGDWQAPSPRRLVPGERLPVSGVGTVELVPAREGGFALAEGEVVTLSWRRGGERCRLRDRGGRRSLKKLLQEAGVPPWWRDRVPLVYGGEELLAVGDLWLCDSSRLWPAGEGWQVLWRRNTPSSRD